MKLVILANNDIASNYALNILLPRIAAHEIVILLSSSVGALKPRLPELENLKFFEQQLFTEILFPLVSQKSKGQEEKLLSFNCLGEMIGNPINYENAINGKAAIESLTILDPDLIISIRYGGILKQEIINIPTHGVINLHSGLLPDYRGVMASFWAMLNEDKELGTTLHFISDSTIDTGGIISHASVPAKYNESYLSNVLGLYPVGCKLILDAVEAIARGESLQCKSQSGEGKYFTFPNKRELEAFQIKGFRLFDTEEVLKFSRRYM